MKHFVSQATFGALIAALVTAPVAAGAQSTASAGGVQAWYGCWSAEQTIIPTVSTIGPIVCITPTSNSSVADVSTLQEGKVVSHTQLDASGVDRAITDKGCTGTQRATWSSDRRRIYLESSGSCERVARATSGILAITPSGDWLDIQDVSAGGDTTVRFARYHDIGIPRSAPAEIAAALQGHDLAIQTARLAAGAPARMSDVIEASRSVDAGVVEGWLLERGQVFSLSARDLLHLADAGVPSRVTDALVAVSNPQTFGVAHGQDDSLAIAEGTDPVVRRGVTAYPAADPYHTPWGWGYSPYGYNAYGYNRYGYGAYGYPGFFYGPPVVTVNGRDVAHGRMVKGQGYSGGTSGSTSGSSRPSQPSSGGSTARTPSSTPSAPPRTAKPRD